MDRHLFVIFGATGDLTKRKLLPALYHLIAERDLGICVVLGVARSDLDDDGFRKLAREALADAGFDGEQVAAWCDSRLHYQQVASGEDHQALATRIGEIEHDQELPGNRVFYLALPPSAFGPTVTGLGEAGLVDAEGWVRLVVEKPFGRDLASARELNDLVHDVFAEEQVYRIDHYLGKETVQNLLTFRFANTTFESLWNRDRIDQVQITVAESRPVGGRGGYYEQAGAIRDMVQNHLSQVLALVAMEAPSGFDPVAIRNEKVKVLNSIAPIDPQEVILGQYVTGTHGDEAVPGYRDEAKVAGDSATPTYAALRLAIHNWRWQGVPFLIRTGKALPRRVTQIAVRFKRAPVAFFETMADHDDLHSDVLLITLQPDEGFELRIDVKKPGERLRLETIPLHFEYGAQFGHIPDAYETLLADVIQGDQTLFVRADEVEASWRLYQPLLDDPPPLEFYAAGSWGPTEAEDLVGDGRTWITR